jgi:hypothetical protein
MEDIQRAQHRMELDAMGEKIVELEGKALESGRDEDQLALIDLRMAYIEARLALAQGDDGLEGKALLEVARETPETQQRRFIAALMPILTLPGIYAKNYETGRNLLVKLLEGERQPKDDLERAAVELWRALLERQEK